MKRRNPVKAGLSEILASMTGAATKESFQIPENGNGFTEILFTCAFREQEPGGKAISRVCFDEQNIDADGLFLDPSQGDSFIILTTRSSKQARMKMFMGFESSVS